MVNGHSRIRLIGGTYIYLPLKKACVREYIWLVVDLPLWKIWKSNGIMNFPTELKNKIHVPNHQPAMEMEIELPSGKHTKSELENHHRLSSVNQLFLWSIFNSYLKLPEGTPFNWFKLVILHSYVRLPKGTCPAWGPDLEKNSCRRPAIAQQVALVISQIFGWKIPQKYGMINIWISICWWFIIYLSYIYHTFIIESPAKWWLCLRICWKSKERQRSLLSDAPQFFACWFITPLTIDIPPHSIYLP